MCVSIDLPSRHEPTFVPRHEPAVVPRRTGEQRMGREDPSHAVGRLKALLWGGALGGSTACTGLMTLLAAQESNHPYVGR